MHEDLAELFVLIVAIQRLEDAYIGGYCKGDEYTKRCNELLSQYKTWAGDTKPDLDKFMRENKLKCARAAERIKVGVPATVVNGVKESDGTSEAAAALEVGQLLITIRDLLGMETKNWANDDLTPYLEDLVICLNRFQSMTADHEVRQIANKWYKHFKNMTRASDTLSEEEARQMGHELERLGTALSRFLKDM